MVMVMAVLLLSVAQPLMECLTDLPRNTSRLVDQEWASFRTEFRYGTMNSPLQVSVHSISG